MTRLTTSTSLVFTVVCAQALSSCASPPQPCGEPIEARDSTPRQVTVLGDDLSPLRTDFNRESDQWRVVALVSPTCSECVLGAEAVEKAITARYPASQVGALIVWIPMLESDSEQAARASATIFAPQRASQFYDAHQTLGTRYAQQTFAGFYERARKSLPDDHRLTAALDDRAEMKRPQWDLYMLYAPGIRWDEASEAPPMPTHWIRHLGRKADRRTSVYWQDSPESGPREGDLSQAIRAMADESIGKPQAMWSARTIEVDSTSPDREGGVMHRRAEYSPRRSRRARRQDKDQTNPDHRVEDPPPRATFRKRPQRDRIGCHTSSRERDVCGEGCGCGCQGVAAKM